MNETFEAGLQQGAVYQAEGQIKEQEEGEVGRKEEYEEALRYALVRGSVIAGFKPRYVIHNCSVDQNQETFPVDSFDRTAEWVGANGSLLALYDGSRNLLYASFIV